MPGVLTLCRRHGAALARRGEEGIERHVPRIDAEYGMNDTGFWHGHVSTNRQQASETIHCQRGRWHASDESPVWTRAHTDSSSKRDGPEDDARPRADSGAKPGGGDRS